MERHEMFHYQIYKVGRKGKKNVSCSPCRKYSKWWFSSKAFIPSGRIYPNPYAFLVGMMGVVYHSKT
jgi:hypothetical protein